MSICRLVADEDEEQENEEPEEDEATGGEEEDEEEDEEEEEGTESNRGRRSARVQKRSLPTRASTRRKVAKRVKG